MTIDLGVNAITFSKGTSAVTVPVNQVELMAILNYVTGDTLLPHKKFKLHSGNLVFENHEKARICFYPKFRPTCQFVSL